MSKLNPIRDEYMAHIEKQKLSGLSIKKYCEENNLVEHKLSYYRSYNPGLKTRTRKKSFAKVNITQPVEIKNNIDPVWLASFLKQLMSNK